MCGSVQLKASAQAAKPVHKLKVYCLRLDRRRIQYVPGTPPTSLVLLDQQIEGFMLMGIPLVTGEPT